MTVKNNLLLHLIVEDGKNAINDYVAKIMPCQLKTTQALVYKVYFKWTFRTGTYGGQKKQGRKKDYNWPSMCGSMFSGTRLTNSAPH